MAEQQKPGLFARICCCSRNDKEPTVTLIRTNDLPNAPQSSISPVKETVDGFLDQSLGEFYYYPSMFICSEVPKDDSGPKEVFRGAAPKWKVENKEEPGEDEIKECQMNMNDVVLTDVCGDEEEKPNVEVGEGRGVHGSSSRMRCQLGQMSSKKSTSPSYGRCRRS